MWAKPGSCCAGVQEEIQEQAEELKAEMKELRAANKKLLQAQKDMAAAHAILEARSGSSDSALRSMEAKLASAEANADAAQKQLQEVSDHPLVGTGWKDVPVQPYWEMSVMACRVSPGGGQGGERIFPVVGHPGTVTEELAAAVDGGAL